VGEAGGGQVQFLQVEIHLTGLDQTEFEIGRSLEAAPGKSGAPCRAEGEQAKDDANP
jgi:hypothetical protein